MADSLKFLVRIAIIGLSTSLIPSALAGDQKQDFVNWSHVVLGLLRRRKSQGLFSYAVVAIYYSTSLTVCVGTSLPIFHFLRENFLHLLKGCYGISRAKSPHLCTVTTAVDKPQRLGVARLWMG